MTIKIGFIGTGGISRAHLNCLKTRKDVAIAGLSDLVPDRAEERSKEFGGETFTDYRTMLDKTQPDAVYVCTPPNVRREPLLACADRGIPVFCEKPVELREKIAVGIARELAERKARVQIGYVFRSIPLIAELKKAMADDRPHLIQSFYGCGVSLSMSLPTWFYDKAKSGGALVDQATHNLDLLRYLFGEVQDIRGVCHNPVRRKKGHYTIDETLGVVFKFRSGMLGSHIHTWVGDSWRNEIFISGEKRLYRLFLNRKQLVIEDPAQGNSNPASGKPAEAKANTPPRPSQADNRSIYEYENGIFLRMVKTGDWTGNPCDYADGLKSLQLALACDRAIQHRA